MQRYRSFTEWLRENSDQIFTGSNQPGENYHLESRQKSKQFSQNKIKKTSAFLLGNLSEFNIAVLMKYNSYLESLRNWIKYQPDSILRQIDHQIHIQWSLKKKKDI